MNNLLSYECFRRLISILPISIRTALSPNRERLGRFRKWQRGKEDYLLKSEGDFSCQKEKRTEIYEAVT